MSDGEVACSIAQIKVLQGFPEEAIAIVASIDLDALPADSRHGAHIALFEANLALARVSPAKVNIDLALTDYGTFALGRWMRAVWSARTLLEAGDVGEAISELSHLKDVATSPNGRFFGSITSAVHATVAGQRDDHERAACLYGYWDQARVDVGYSLYPRDLARLNSAVQSSRRVLGDAAFDRLTTTGATLDFAELPLYDS